MPLYSVLFCLISWHLTRAKQVKNLNMIDPSLLASDSKLLPPKIRYPVPIKCFYVWRAYSNNRLDYSPILPLAPSSTQANSIKNLLSANNYTRVFDHGKLLQPEGEDGAMS